MKFRYTGRIIVKIAYGYSIKDDDPFTSLIDEVGKMVQNSGSLGSTPVDFFPRREFIQFVNLHILNSLVAHFPSWFPGTYYATYARKWRGLAYELRNYMFNFTVKQLVCMFCDPSIILFLIK